jgi:hypothetical protein
VGPYHPVAVFLSVRLREGLNPDCAQLTDSALKRPTPLQIVADGGGGFRLYSGRKFVVLIR